MRRLVLTTGATLAGVAALLSVKTETAPASSAGPLPSAALPAAATASASAGPAQHSPAVRSVVGKAVTTRYGIVQVKASVAGGRIIDIAFTQLTAFDHHSRRINADAGPKLLRETLAKQTAKVDTVSGASYTSAGYRESAQSALDQAGLR